MRSIEGFGGDAVLAQPGGDALAELLAVLADHDGGLPGKLICPVGDGVIGAAPRSGDQPGIADKILIETDIKQSRRGGRADQACKFINGNGGV
jgi:hypothetical protein